MVDTKLDLNPITGKLDLVLDGDEISSTYTPRTEWGANGFESQSDSTLTWTDSGPDRTLSIQPTGSSFNYWIGGIEYTSTGDTKQITDTEGIWVFYYDSSGLQAVNNPTLAQVDSVIRTKAIACIIYWNATDNEAIYVGEERHGKVMSPSTHAYLHFIEGLRYISGLGLNTINADGTGTTADAQFGVDVGAVADEDIYDAISAIDSTTGLPIYYMIGSTPRWLRHIEAGFSARTYDGTTSTRLAWNEYTGGSWQLSQVTNNDFVLCHVFATTEKDKPMIAIMGQAEYNTKRLAREGAIVEIKSLVTNDLLFPEIRPIATVIFKSNTSYASAINALIVSTDEGDDYVDWRDTTISRAEISTSDHGSLTGLGDDDHPQYIRVDGTSSIGVTIPFANGIEVLPQYQDGPNITFGDADTGLVAYGANSFSALAGGSDVFAFGYNLNTSNVRLLVTQVPTGTTATTSSFVINPASATSNSLLQWAGVNNIRRWSVDEDGDTYQFGSQSIGGNVDCQGNALFLQGLETGEEDAGANVLFWGSGNVIQGGQFFYDVDDDHITINANMDFTGNTYNFGIDGKGIDLNFFTETAGRGVFLDQSIDTLHFKDNTFLGFGSNTGGDVRFFYNGTDFWLDGVSKAGYSFIVDMPLEIGTNGYGSDAIFYGASVGQYMQWDASQDGLRIQGSLGMNIIPNPSILQYLLATDYSQVWNVTGTVSGNFTVMSASPTWTPTLATSTFYGLNFIAVLGESAQQGDNWFGVYSGFMNMAYTGELDNIAVYTSSLVNVVDLDADIVIGYHVNHVSYGGTWGEHYGIKIENIDYGTNKWAIHTGTGKVEFNDILEINNNNTYGFTINRTGVGAKELFKTNTFLQNHTITGTTIIKDISLSSAYSTSGYQLSVQSSGVYSYMEMLNATGGTSKGAFFGLNGFDFELWNWQNSGPGSGNFPIVFYAGDNGNQIFKIDRHVAYFGDPVTMAADDFTCYFNGSNIGAYMWREDEDYFDFLDTVRTSAGRMVNTTRLTTTTTLDASHDNVFCDTDGGAFTINLPAGVNGTKYRIINCGTSGNDITITPNGTEKLTGASASKTISDSIDVILVYETTEGWY